MDDSEMEKWHDKEEQYLEKMERQCDVLHTHHMRDYHYYNHLSSKFNVPILVISAVNALTAIGLNSFMKQEFVSIMNAVLSTGCGVIGSIQLYMKINEKMTNSLRSTISFKRLSLKISKELSIDRELRVTEGQPFLAECFAELNTSIEQGNPLDKAVENFMSFGAVEAAVKSPMGSPMMRRVAERLLEFAGSPVTGRSPGSGTSSAASSPQGYEP
jgi:hypothetical protein